MGGSAGARQALPIRIIDAAVFSREIRQAKVDPMLVTFRPQAWLALIAPR